MDGPDISPDRRYVLLDTQIADIIEGIPPDLLKELLGALEFFTDCECGCQGRNHAREAFVFVDEVTRLRHDIAATTGE